MSQNINEVEIVDINKFRDIVLEKDAVYLYQDTSNMAQVYKFKDGRIGIMPAIGNKCLLFGNEDIFKEKTKEGLPIKEENPNPFQKFAYLINELENNVPSILGEMEKDLNIKLNFENEDDKYYDIISKAINNSDIRMNFDKLFIQVTVLIGEIIKKRLKQPSWQLDKRYGYNPYFEPCIVDHESGTVYYPWYKLSEMVLKSKKFSLKKQIKLSLTKF